MTRMNCIIKKPDGTECGVEIDYDRSTKKAKNLDGTDHFHPKKKNFSSGKARPIESDLELLGKISSVEARLDTLEQAVKALVQELNEGSP